MSLDEPSEGSNTCETPSVRSGPRGTLYRYPWLRRIELCRVSDVWQTLLSPHSGAASPVDLSHRSPAGVRATHRAPQFPETHAAPRLAYPSLGSHGPVFCLLRGRTHDGLGGLEAPAGVRSPQSFLSRGPRTWPAL